MRKLLLHVCCGPCSTHVITELGKEYEIIIFFCNPNIYPKEEYERRLSASKEVAKKMNIGFIEGEYDFDLWNNSVKGFESEPEGGKRCDKCIEIRLKKTAELAKAQGFDIFSTTLTTGPQKSPKKINEIGKKVGGEFWIEFLSADFKKKDGHLKSIKMSNEMGIYRQNYCGCEFSMRSEDSALVGRNTRA